MNSEFWITWSGLHEVKTGDIGKSDRKGMWTCSYSDIQLISSLIFHYQGIYS